MKQFISPILPICLLFLLIADCSTPPTKMQNTYTRIEAKNKTRELSCKLSSPELLKRKATVLASLRKQILEKKELKNGYAFRFEGSDKTVDELIEFIKAERQCCDFFTFDLSISGDKSEVWLELTGETGAKDFIKEELELL